MMWGLMPPIYKRKLKMIDLGELIDKLRGIKGLANALDKMIWNIEDVPKENKEDFNSILILSEYLINSLNSFYNLIKDEV